MNMLFSLLSDKQYIIAQCPRLFEEMINNLLCVLSMATEEREFLFYKKIYLLFWLIAVEVVSNAHEMGFSFDDPRLFRMSNSFQYWYLPDWKLLFHSHSINKNYACSVSAGSRKKLPQLMATIENCMHMVPMMIQALSTNASPLLQLPHIGPNQVRQIAHGQVGFNLCFLLTLVDVRLPFNVKLSIFLICCSGAWRQSVYSRACQMTNEGSCYETSQMSSTGIFSMCLPQCRPLKSLVVVK